MQLSELSQQHPLVCPFDCSGMGRCTDPRAAASSSAGDSGGPTISSITQQPLPSAAQLTPLGPMQDVVPVDAGFFCDCFPGRGGALCEGVLTAVRVGSGEQRLPPVQLQPGDWAFYQVKCVTLSFFVSGF